jgi:hypothetical protein
VLSRGQTVNQELHMTFSSPQQRNIAHGAFRPNISSEKLNSSGSTVTQSSDLYPGYLFLFYKFRVSLKWRRIKSAQKMEEKAIELTIQYFFRILCGILGQMEISLDSLY